MDAPRWSVQPGAGGAWHVVVAELVVAECDDRDAAEAVLDARRAGIHAEGCPGARAPAECRCGARWCCRACREAQEERAAILEYDGGMERDEADAEASSSRCAEHYGPWADWSGLREGVAKRGGLLWPDDQRQRDET